MKKFFTNLLLALCISTNAVAQWPAYQFCSNLWLDQSSCIKPSLNLSLYSYPIDSRITFTRGSAGTYFDSTGTLQTASTNVARLDYDPSTLAARGLLIEEARTNSIRNNTMVGASAGTPGSIPTNWSTFTALTGLTRTVVGTGTENGISYIDIRLSGTPSAAGSYYLQFETSTQIAASNGQSWTSSVYSKLVAGTTTGVTFNLRTGQRDAGGADLGSVSTVFVPTGSALSTQRTSTPLTNNSASVAFELPYYDFALSGVAIDITLRIGLPQLELGAFATSVIQTSSAAVTRAADIASMTGTNFSSWYNQTQGTFVVKARMSAPAISAYGPYRIDDGTDTQRVMLRDSGGGLLGFVIVDGGVTQANLSAGNTITANALFSHAAAYQLNDIATSYNGAAVLTDNAATIPAVNRMLIGVGGTTTSYLNGWIQSIQYYPIRVSDGMLKRLSLVAADFGSVYADACFSCANDDVFRLSANGL